VLVDLATWAIVLHFVSCVFMLLHLTVFEGDGIGAPNAEKLGHFFAAWGQLAMFALLLVISKGLAISTETIPEDDKKRIVCLMGCLCVLYVTLYLYTLLGLDPASTISTYQTVPGVLLALLWLVIAVFFAASVHATRTAEVDDAKRAFYGRFGACFTLWLTWLPCFVLVGSLLEPWERKKVVTGLDLTGTWCALAAMAYLLWPSRAGEHFILTAPTIDETTGQVVSTTAAAPYDRL
jgi:hypothetical protein